MFDVVGLQVNPVEALLVLTNAYADSQGRDTLFSWTVQICVIKEIDAWSGEVEMKIVDESR